MSHPVKIFTDGGSRGNPGPAASAFVVVDDTLNKILYRQGFYLGATTNNQAEYRAVLYALQWLAANQSNISNVQFCLDSQLVVNQVKGIYKIKDPALKIHLDNLRRVLAENIKIPVMFTYVPRAQNYQADALVNSTLDSSNSSS